MKQIASIFMLGLWLAGIVLAKSAWSVFFAIFFPLWAYYLVVEQLVHKYLL